MNFSEPTLKKKKEPTLVLDISDIKYWGLLAFSLGFSFSVLMKRPRKVLNFTLFQLGGLNAICW